MIADGDFDGTLLDPGLWDQILWGLFILTSALVVILITPSLVSWVLSPGRSDSPERAPSGNGEAAEGQTAGAAGAPNPEAQDERPVAQRGGLSRVRPRSARERRKSLRRKGPPTPALLSEGCDEGATVPCSVVDRARGGLGIVVDHPYPVGALISVRPVEAPEDVPWIRLEVRSCRPRGEKWCLGCRFTEDLSWAAILVFG